MTFRIENELEETRCPIVETCIEKLSGIAASSAWHVTDKGHLHTAGHATVTFYLRPARSKASHPGKKDVHAVTAPIESTIKRQLRQLEESHDALARLVLDAPWTWTTQPTTTITMRADAPEFTPAQKVELHQTKIAKSEIVHEIKGAISETVVSAETVPSIAETDEQAPQNSVRWPAIPEVVKHIPRIQTLVNGGAWMMMGAIPFLFGALMTIMACGLILIKFFSIVVTFSTVEVDDDVRRQRREIEIALDGTVQIMLFIVAYVHLWTLPSVIAIGLVAADVGCKTLRRIE